MGALLPPASQRHVDHQGHVVAEARPAPFGEAPDAQFAQAGDPVPRNEDVVDVVGRPVLLAVAPVVGRRALGALRLAPRAYISRGCC